MKAIRYIRARRLAALLLAAALLLSSCGGGTTATTMRLKRTEGTVDVSDDGGKDIEPRENLGLYSGYGVDTRSESYAWIDLDDVKLTKLDQDSEIEIRKDGKDLEITVSEGSLFFNVTEPLEDDETMTIRASSMLVGVRGTCGWVALSEDKSTLTVGLLEGKVECSNGETTAAVSAGELGTIPASGEITVTPLTAAQVPAFVAEEIEEDGDLAEAILDASGIDLTGGGTGGNVPGEYADVLAQIEGEILYTEMVDFEADGSPELLVLSLQDGNNPNKGAAHLGVTVLVYRNGPEGPSPLFGGNFWLYNKEHYRNGKLSLVEAGGRIFIKYYFTYVDDNYTNEGESYMGSVAQRDGSVQDWGIVEQIDRTQGDSRAVRFPKKNGLVDKANGGTVEGLSLEEYEAISGAYSEVKVLAYTPDNASLVVLPDPSEMEEPSRPDGST